MYEPVAYLRDCALSMSDRLAQALNQLLPFLRLTLSTEWTCPIHFGGERGIVLRGVEKIHSHFEDEFWNLRLFGWELGRLSIC